MKKLICRLGYGEARGRRVFLSKLFSRVPAGQAGVCLFLCFRFMLFHSQSGAPLTSHLWELCLQVSSAWGLTPSAPLTHIKLDAVWWQQWRSLYRYLPFVLYFLRLLTSSLNINQVFHLLFKTCFKQASTSSYAIKYAFQSPDFFRNTIVFFWKFYLLIKTAQFLLLRSSKCCRRSYCPWLAIWFTVSVAHTPAFVLLYPWNFFRSTFRGLAEEYEPGIVLLHWQKNHQIPVRGNAKHRLKHWRWADFVFYLQLLLCIVYILHRQDQEAELGGEQDALGDAASLCSCSPITQQSSSRRLLELVGLVSPLWASSC